MGAWSRGARGRGAALVMLAVSLAGCAEHSAGHAGHAGVNMGDPDAVPADQVPGAALAIGRFSLLDTAPSGFQDVAGTAMLARYDGGTTVTIELSGLKPGTAFISHVHAGTCENGGGAHYKFEPDGGDMPPNEIHLAFTSTVQGTGSATVQNDRTAGPNARSVVVHPRDLIDNRVACAPLR